MFKLCIQLKILLVDSVKYFVFYLSFYTKLFVFCCTGLLHLIYCQENELNIISETNLINLWPFSFFPWLISFALCPIQFFNTSLNLLYFSPAIIDLGVNIIICYLYSLYYNYVFSLQLYYHQQK